MVSSSGNAGLSKSLILTGMQCPKALYLAKNPPTFKFPSQHELKAKQVGISTFVRKPVSERQLGPILNVVLGA